MVFSYTDALRSSQAPEAPSTSVVSTKVVIPTTFHRFGDLPIELQWKIWDYLAPRPRAIEIMKNPNNDMEVNDHKGERIQKIEVDMPSNELIAYEAPLEYKGRFIIQGGNYYPVMPLYLRKYKTCWEQRVQSDWMPDSRFLSFGVIMAPSYDVIFIPPELLRPFCRRSTSTDLQKLECKILALDITGREKMECSHYGNLATWDSWKSLKRYMALIYYTLQTFVSLQQILIVIADRVIDEAEKIQTNVEGILGVTAAKHRAEKNSKGLPPPNAPKLTCVTVAQMEALDYQFAENGVTEKGCWNDRNHTYPTLEGVKGEKVQQGLKGLQGFNHPKGWKGWKIYR